MKLWLVVGLYDREQIEIHSSHPTRIGAEIARRERLLAGFCEKYTADDTREVFGGLPEDLLDELVAVVASGGMPASHVVEILEQVGSDASLQYQLFTQSVDLTVEEIMELLAVEKAKGGCACR